jgi:uncharacterized membrane protein
VAVSAVLHVGWNVRLKTAGDPLVAWLDGRPSLPLAGIGLGLLSGVIEAVYFVLLAAAYRRGDLSVVYPIARGTAPLLLVAVGVGLLGEQLGVPGWLGVGGLIAGFLLLQRPWLVVRDALRGRRPDSAIAFALATGVAIAGYTSVDRVGTRLIDPVPYAAILWLSGSVLLAGWVVLRGGPAARRPAGGEVRHAAVGGLLTLGAYLLVLFALSVAPLSGVAPLRESATVLAAAWGAVRLGEAVERADAVRRIAASGLIVAGAILLALDA